MPLAPNAFRSCALAMLTECHLAGHDNRDLQAHASPKEFELHERHCRGSRPRIVVEVVVQSTASDYGQASPTQPSRQSRMTKSRQRDVPSILSKSMACATPHFPMSPIVRYLVTCGMAVM